MDDSDKGTAKALSAAYKSAMLQAFCIPVPQQDADATSPPVTGVAYAEPPEGWDSWTGEFIHIASSCETSEAIDRLAKARRGVLAALQRSRPDLYVKVGEAIAARIGALNCSQDRCTK